MAAPRPTKCPRCRASVVPVRFAKGPTIRESLDSLIMPAASVVYAFDKAHLRCPACAHAWRPRLQERGLLIQIIAWPILFAGVAIGLVVIFLAVTGQFP